MKDISILIVEDEAIVAKSIEKRLNSLGYHVTGTVARGEDVLEMLQAKRPDLVLLDIRLEGTMDGVDTSQVIHDRYRIPVVFITAYSDDTTIERAAKTGPYGYLLKPFGETELRSMLQTVFSRIELDRLEKEGTCPKESLCQEIFDCHDVAMVVVTGNEVALVNQAFETLTGYSRQEITGKLALEDIILPEFRPAVQENLGRFISGTPVEQEGVSAKIVTKDAKSRNVRVCFGRLPRGDGVVVSFF
ncbi:MAG: response regulator [Methanoregula sp.]|jgi:PAS domain S-box-containing protein